jgi:glycosyltransferase involved in cell wall biosynthesis
MATDGASATATRVSVCMATYRGAAFVAEQLASILAQLGPDDEIVVVDDASPDDTAEIVANITDQRIRLVRLTENGGYVRAFERALTEAMGEYLFYSDQDDVWAPGRLDEMMTALGGALFVAGNYSVLGESAVPPSRTPLRPEFDTETTRNLFGIMIGYRPYFGCGMGMTRAALPLLMPIPAMFTESHDLWTAIVGNTAHSIRHLSRVVVERRLHDANQTPLGWRSPGLILRARWMLFRALFVARSRVRAAR